MASAADGIAIFQEELVRSTGITVSFLAGVNLTRPVEQVDSIFRSLSQDAELASHFAGIDINFLPGDLAKLIRHLPTIRSLQVSGLKVNIHLGELFDNEISRHVLEALTPDRIGHGVLLLRDKSLIDIVRSTGVCLDMCPTSNTLLGVVDWTRESPARHALQLGIPISLNTDDPILFNTNLDREIQLAGLSDAELESMVAHTKKHRYAAS